MLDVFNTIVPSTADYKEFYAPTANDSARRTQVWNKPRGVSMIRFLLIGAGGGGANGYTRTGGGSGAVTSWLVPAIFVPDWLIIAPGQGGAGGVVANSAQSGTNGVATNVLLTPSTILLSANAGGGGTASVGAGGTASTVSGITTVGVFNSVAGQAGAASLTAITPSATTFLTGGAGGGTTNNVVGASVTPLYGYPVLAGGPGTGSSAARRGRNGYFITQPIMFGCGGSGGGDGGAGTGGNGGDGGIGCGGGGGGQQGNTLFAGAGGKGGGGAVFIWAW